MPKKKPIIRQLPPNVRPVTIVGQGFDNPRLITEYRRSFPNGATAPFRIPNGFLFIVTDVEAFVITRESNRNLRFTIDLLMEQPLTITPLFVGTIPIDESGQGGISTSLSSGFLIGSNITIRTLFPVSEDAITQIYMHGYFTRA